MEKGRGKGTDTLQTDEVFTRMEYIEREALLRYLNDIWLTATPTDTMSDDDRPLAIARCMGLNDAMDAVKEAPAADVVPVVRCKECRFCVHDKGFDELWCNGKRRKADWFCADGERKDGDGDGV